MTRYRTAGRISTTPLILIAALAAALGLWLGARMLGAPALPALAAVTLFPQPRALPDFHLTRSTGESLTLADWKGRWTVAYFGYTHCPDVCPTTLAAFKQTWKLLDSASAQKLRFDFISVDPARDTPEQLARYVGYFSKDFVAATGTDDELTGLTHALGLVYSHEKSADGSDVVDHSAAAVIIDPRGNEAGILRPPFEPAKIAADLTMLAASR
ncbi:MAG: SCO family protein [Dokdonella sp.]